MGIFGWDYPPGCHSVPGDEDEYCEVCGRSVDNDECICPECPVCFEQGDPDCYREMNGVQHMQRTQAQRDSMAEMDKYWEEENRKEYEAEAESEHSRLE